MLKFNESNRYILKKLPLPFHRRHFQKPPRHDPPTMLSELRQFQAVGMLQLLQKQPQSNQAYFLLNIKIKYCNWNTSSGTYKIDY